MRDRLFTPRFLTMFGYSVTVFLSLFQLLPTAPYHVMGLGGSMAVAGLFHGFLTFSSACSAPVTGPISDRLGHRPVLIVVSLLLTALTLSYAFISSYHVLFAVVVVHGVIWSSLLSASGAYMAASIPASRRGEGLGYWGMASVLAFGTAPVLGFWVYRHGWVALCIETAGLNLLMAVIAWYLPDDRADVIRARQEAAAQAGTSAGSRRLQRVHADIEWRVIVLSIGIGLISFGYGGLTSFAALFADDIGLSPRSLLLSALAAAMVVSRLMMGRSVDRLGHRRVLVPSLLVPSLGLWLLAVVHGPFMLVCGALVFGAGFGVMYPTYTAYILTHVSESKRGAAFGAILAAFDTGIGTGASLMGWLASRHGFRATFAIAGAVGVLSLPYFVVAERRLGFGRDGSDRRGRR
jgi:MFS family permease